MVERSQDSWADGLVEKVAVGLAARSSRRSLLGRLATPVLLFMGVGISPLMPVARQARAQGPAGPVTIDGCTYPAGTTVSDKSLCAMSGSPCTSCTGANLDFTGNCPAVINGSPLDDGTNRILQCGSWTGCCPYGDNGAPRTAIYVDCCAVGFAPSGEFTCTITCSNQGSCKEGPNPATNGTVYCKTTDCGTTAADGRAYYVCTYVSKPTGGCV